MSAETPAHPGGRTGIWRNVLILAAGYALVRVLLAVGRLPDDTHIDTVSYREGVSLWGNAPRMWVVPLVQLLPDSMAVIVQAAVSGVAFVALAVALASTIVDRRVQLGLAGLVLAIGLAPRVTYWDTMMLSESLALSFTALLIAGLVWLDRVPWWAFATVFALWLFTRDGHLYIGAVMVAGVAWWAWKRRRWALPVACLIGLVWNFAAAQNDRYVEGSVAAAGIAYYSVRDPANFVWLIDHGMPNSVSFASGALDEEDDRPGHQRIFHHIYHDPEWRAWADSEGQALYVRFLLAHPAYLVERVPFILQDSGETGEALVDHAEMLPAGRRGLPFVWPDEASWYTFALVAVAGLATLAAARRRLVDRRWLLPGLIAASALPQFYLALIASPYEYARHGLIGAFCLVISCWWILALAVDVWLRQNQPSACAAASSVMQSASESSLEYTNT